MRRGRLWIASSWGGLVPIYKYAFYSNSRPFRTETEGVGYPELYVGYQLTPTGQYAFGSTVYLRGKIPTTTPYPYTNQAILGEGQFDLAAALANSLEIFPRVYLNTSFEFRYRFPWLGNNDDPDLFAGPGEEFHLSGGLGASVTSWLWVNAGYSGFWGTPWIISWRGFDEQPQARIQRQFHTVMVSTYIGIGEFVGAEGLALDAFVKLPLRGPRSRPVEELWPRRGVSILMGGHHSACCASPTRDS